SVRLGGIHVPTTDEIRAYRSTRRGCASNASRSAAPADAEIRVSSVAPLAICWRLDVPPLFQRLADLCLAELFLFRKIFIYAARLTVLGHKFRWLHVIRLPIQIENLLLRTQKVFRMPVTLETPRHAVRLRLINHWHVIDWTMAAETTDATIHVRRVIVIN